MGKLILTVFLALISTFSSADLNARQIAFNRQVSADSIEYQHRFLTRSGRPASLVFTLNTHDVKASRHRFTSRSREQLLSAIKQESSRIFNSMQQEYLDRAREEFDRFINQQVKQLPEGINIINVDQGRNFKVSTDGSISRARAEKIIDRFLKTMHNKWDDLNESYLDKFEDDVYIKLRKHYAQQYKARQFVATFNRNEKLSYKLRVDFIEVAKKQTSKVRSIARAIDVNTRDLTQRQRINYSLNFIQSIPYDTLNSRNASADIGFVEPVTLFDINRGDCDTKSTALAAVLRNLYPQMKMVMILVPGHAFLAAAISPQKGDRTLTYQGVRYVVLEAAGPALTLAGQAYPTSLVYLDQRHSRSRTVLPVL